MTDREFVEAHWDRTWLYEGKRKLELSLAYPIKFPGATKDGADSLWSAAAAFTCDRLEEIRQLREEIEWMGFYDFNDKAEDARARIVVRLESILADLQRGMKAGEEQSA